MRREWEWSDSDSDSDGNCRELKGFGSCRRIGSVHRGKLHSEKERP